MITLKRKYIKFYLNVILFITLAVAFIIIPFILAQKTFATDKRTLFFILFMGLAIMCIYFLISLIKKVPLVRFNEEGLFLGKNYLKWADCTEINFDINGFIWGSSTVCTEFHNAKKQKLTLYNSYYSNYVELSRFILCDPHVLQSVTVSPQINKSETLIMPEDMSYAGYRFFSTHFFVVLYVLFIGATLIGFSPINLHSVALIILVVIIFFTTLLICVPNIIKIENGALSIEKQFLPLNVRSFLLKDIYAVRYFYRSRGPRLLMIVTKEFEPFNFYMDTIPKKKFKQLKMDLESFGIIVIDEVTIEMGKMTFNMSFNLSRKKNKRS